MRPHKLTIFLFLIFLNQPVLAQRRKAPPGGRIAVVVDEQLSALRETPQLAGRLIRRLGRGRLVAVRGSKTTRDGVTFYLVNVTSRTHGWIQSDALVSRFRNGDDEKLLRLVMTESSFDRLVLLRIFLDSFPNSRLRPQVLILLGGTAEELAQKLARDAARRLSKEQQHAPEFSYFLNYSGLDRYNRQGVLFMFDTSKKEFHYDGASWRELIRRYPRSREAVEARQRLNKLNAMLGAQTSPSAKFK